MERGFFRAAATSVVVLYRRRRVLPLFLVVSTGFFIGFFKIKLSNFADLHNNVAEGVEPLSRHQLKLWEQPTLLKANFSWIYKNEGRCKLNANEPKDLRILPILVHSSRHNFRERLTIRKTWGSVHEYRNWTIRLVFLLGQNATGLNDHISKEDLEVNEKKLQDEQRQFGDIVIGGVIESYRTLAYKHLMGYKWILNFCSEAALVLKTDDDTFINIFEWLDWRMHDLNELFQRKVPKVPDLYCMTFKKGDSPPIRNASGTYLKWFVSFEDWPEPIYPSYCSGWAYGITVELLQKIYSVSNDRKMFWIDDIFVTGALLELAKEKYNFQPEVGEVPWTNVIPSDKNYRPSCVNGTFDARSREKVHHLTTIERDEFFERDMRCLWNKTLHDRKRKDE